MNLDQATSIVDYLTAGFSRSVDAPTIAVWAEALGAFPMRCAHGAAQRAVRELTRMPSIAEFLQLVDEELWALKDLDEAQHSERELRAGPEDVARREMFRLNAEAWTKALTWATKNGVRHAEECGGRHRDYCPAGCTWDVAVKTRLRALRKEGNLIVPPEQPTIQCRDCGDRGLVLVDDEAHGTFQPCLKCRPDTYDRWVGGHYMPGHDCEECRALRQRRKPKQEAAT